MNLNIPFLRGVFLFFVSLAVVAHSTKHTEAAEAHRKCVAFVVGVEKYDQPDWNRLQYVAEDAYEFWRQLDKMCQIDISRSVLMVCDRQKKGEVPPLSPLATPSKTFCGTASFESLTRASIQSRFDRFLSSIQPGDLVVVFLGGHGGLRSDDLNGSEFGVHFLVSDSAREHRAFLDAINVTNLSAELQKNTARLKGVDVVLIGNICHAVAVGAAGSEPPSDDALANAANDASKSWLEQGKQFAYFPACAGTEEAFEEFDKAGSQFVRAILAGMRGGARDDDGFITTGALLEHIRSTLANKALPHPQNIPEPKGFARGIKLGETLVDELNLRRLLVHSLIAVAADSTLGKVQARSLLRIAELHLNVRQELAGKDDLDQVLLRMQLARMQERGLEQSWIDQVLQESKVTPSLPPVQNSEFQSAEKASDVVKQLGSIFNGSTQTLRKPLVFSILRSDTNKNVVDAVRKTALGWASLFGLEQSLDNGPFSVQTLQSSRIHSEFDKVIELVQRARGSGENSEVVVVVTGFGVPVDSDDVRAIHTAQLKQLSEALGTGSTLIWDIGDGTGERLIKIAESVVEQDPSRAIWITAPGVKDSRWYFTRGKDPLIEGFERSGFSAQGYQDYFEAVKRSSPGLSAPLLLGRPPSSEWLKGRHSQSEEITKVVKDYATPVDWWPIRVTGNQAPWLSMPIGTSDPLRQFQEFVSGNESSFDLATLAKLADSLRDISAGNTSDNQWAKLPFERFAQFHSQLKERATQLDGKPRVLFVPVGAQDFQSPLIGDLRRSRTDTEAWKAALEKTLAGKYQCLTFQPNNCTQAEIEIAIGKAVTTATEADTIVLVYSGRGYQALDGERFIAAEDTQLGTELDEPIDAIDLPEHEESPRQDFPPPWNIRELLDKLCAGKGQVLVVLDCQFSRSRQALAAVPPPLFKNMGSLVTRAEKSRSVVPVFSVPDFSSSPFDSPFVTNLEPSDFQGFDMSIAASEATYPVNRRIGKSRSPVEGKIFASDKKINDRLTVVFWSGMLAESAGYGGAPSPYLAPETYVDTFRFSQTLIKYFDSQALTGSVREWIDRAQNDFDSTVAKRNEVFPPGAMSLEQSADYDDGMLNVLSSSTAFQQFADQDSTYIGYVIQGNIDRRLFTGQPVQITWEQICREFARREVNVLAAREIAMGNGLLEKPCDVLTRAMLVLFETRLLREQYGKLSQKDLERVDNQVEAIQDLVDTGQLNSLGEAQSLVLMAACDLLVAADKAAQAARFLADNLGRFPLGQDESLLLNRFNLVTQLAIQQDADRMLEDLVSRLPSVDRKLDRTVRTFDDDVLEAAPDDHKPDGIVAPLREQLRSRRRNRDDYMIPATPSPNARKPMRAPLLPFRTTTSA